MRTMADLNRITLTGKQAAQFVGVTYRQLDYWLRSGIIDCPETERAPGSGYRRRLTVGSLLKPRALARIQAALYGGNGHGWTLERFADMVDRFDQEELTSKQGIVLDLGHNVELWICDLELTEPERDMIARGDHR